MELFKLFGSIFVDNDKANESLAKTEKQGEGLGKKLGGIGKTALQMGAIVGTGAIAAGAALYGMATKAGDTADRLFDLSDITGMTTDEIQRWEKVTKIAGVSIDTMTNASQKLTKQLNTMDAEGNKSRVALEELGLSIDDINNMNADERMNAITQALAGVEDKTDRARIGTDLLGGAWKDVAPIVGLGADEMQRAKDSANIIDEEKLQKANEFRITVAEMKDQVNYFFMEMAMNAVPIVQYFFDWIKQYMPQIQEYFGVAFQFISQVVDVATEMFKTHLIPVFQSMKDWVVENLPQIQAFFQEAFQYIQGIIEAFVNIVTFLWGFFGDFLIKQTKVLFETVKNVIQGAFSIFRGLLDVFIGLFTGDWSRMGDGLKRIWDGLWKVIESILKGAWGLLKNQFDFLRGKISGWFTGLKDMAVQWGRNMIQGFIDGILGMVNKVRDAASNVMNNVKSFLGFNSPAEEGDGRFITDWGANMIDGFLDGVKRMEPIAGLAMNDIVGAMKPTDSGSSILQSSLNEQESNSYHFAPGSVVLDASNMKTINDVIELLESFKQIVRKG